MKTTLDELQALVAVVDSGSISRAAVWLEQTVSATSRTLARLEAKLHTTLLRRTTRRLELTEEGEAFVARARDILAAVESAEEQMSLRRAQPAGRLRVDAATPFMLHVIAPLAASYRARYPQVQLELHSNEGITDLLERRTDVAFRIGQLKDSTLHAVPLGSTRIRVQASPAYLARHGRPTRVADLRSHTLLGFTQPEVLNQWPLRDPDGDGEALHVRPDIATSSGETLRMLALTGAGIACLSDYSTRQDREQGRLVELFPKASLDMRRPVNAVYYRNTAISARIQSFVDHVKQHIGRPASDGQAWPQF